MDHGGIATHASLQTTKSANVQENKMPYARTGCVDVSRNLSLH